MAVTLNTSNLSVDSSGRTSFSGLSSGIDSKSAIDAIIKARQVPIDSLAARVTADQAKIAAYQELSGLMVAFKASADKLRGAVTFGNLTDVFTNKQAFAAATRTDTATPSAAASIIGVTVANSAALGSHTVEVQRIALAHKIGSGTFSSDTSTLQTALGLGVAVTGNFTVNGTQITVNGTDSLRDLRDRINAANSGVSPTGVGASIVTVAGTTSYLVLTAAKTGTTITLADPNATGVLAKLGISNDGGTTLLNQLQAPQTAQLYADGLLDPSKWLSKSVTDPAAALSTYTTVAGAGNTFDILDKNGAVLKTVTYASTDTLQTLATAITGAGITASVVTSGGKSQLKISKDNGAEIKFANDTNNLLSGLTFSKDRLLIERSSNTIADLFGGITLNLFKSEPGTAIKLDVEQNLNAIKTAISDFVAAYNAVRAKVNTHQLIDPVTGQKTDKTGVLFGEPTLSGVDTQLTSLIGAGADGAPTNLRVLAQLGVKLVDNKTISDPTQKSTLAIDDPTLDNALQNNPDGVRQLFAFQFGSTDSRVTLLSFTANTSYNANGYTLNVGQVGSALQDSASVTNSAAMLNTVQSVNATLSGQFTINGTAIAYNVATDSIDSLATKISNAGILGVSASVLTDGSGNKFLRLSTTTTPLTIAGDTGDLLTRLGLINKQNMIVSANINGPANGSDDGSVTVNGLALTATNKTGASGLRILYSGDTGQSGITLTYSVGVATKMFAGLDNTLVAGGPIDGQISGLKKQDDVANQRIQSMQARLESQRKLLTAKFNAMERALSQMNATLQNVQQMMNSLLGNNNKN